MKVRSGFVSNSSSTSYTCDICGDKWNDYADDFPDFFQCDECHTICEDHFDSLLDVGCNNAICSYKIQKELNKDVLGIDFSDDLELPDDYNFIKEDISNSCAVREADVILFLSLYHHMLGCYGLDKADGIFFKLLLSCNELIFDTGNLSETGYSGTPWYKVLEKHFDNEKDLLDHFGVPY